MTFRQKFYLATWITLGAALAFANWYCNSQHTHDAGYINSYYVALSIWLVPTTFGVLITVVNACLWLHNYLGEIED